MHRKSSITLTANEQETWKAKLLSNRRITETGCWEWTGYLTPKGYGRVGAEPQFRVHRLSAHLFKGFDLNSDLSICHACDNRACFNPDHLFEGDAATNYRDSVTKHRHTHGEKQARAKLTATDVITIRALAASVPQCELATRYGVDRKTIYDAVNRKTWRQLA